MFRLFFGVLPTLKSSWDVDILKQRDDYYVRLISIVIKLILIDFIGSRSPIIDANV